VLVRANAAADPSRGAMVPVKKSIIAPSIPVGKKR